MKEKEKNIYGIHQYTLTRRSVIIVKPKNKKKREKTKIKKAARARKQIKNNIN
jgi:hypothetical protein